MRSKNGLVTAFGIMVLAFSAHADIGPKPAMSFHLVRAGKRISIVRGTLYQCDRPDCRDAAPLRTLGPQHFSCAQTDCDATAYGFAEYSLLELALADGRRLRSRPFAAGGMDSHFDVVVRGRHLAVVSAH